MNEPEEGQDQVAPREVNVVHQGECPSVSGRSVITFEIGKGEQAELLFRIADNSGKGMFCKDWAPISSIDKVLVAAEQVSSRTFHDVHPGKSINTGGFILAVLKHLGVVEMKEDSRYHTRADNNATLERAIAARMKEPPAKTRKGKGG